MFRTPNFRGKKAAIIWMLCLACSLLFIDYYAGPVNTSSGWQMEVLWSRLNNPSQLYYIPGQGLLVKFAETPNGLFYNPRSGIKKEINEVQFSKKLKTFPPTSDKVRLTDGTQIQLEYADRQGRLIWLKNQQQQTIVRRLHQPSALQKDNYNNIYIIEHGRDRVLKFNHD